MKKTTLLTLLMALLMGAAINPLHAQDQNDKDLEAAVKIYNDLNDIVDKLHVPNDVTAEIKADYDKRSVIAINLLDGVITNGTTDQKKTAAYFKVNMKYLHIFIMQIEGRNAESGKEVELIKTEFESYADASKFPLRYKFNEKNYIIEYKNFEPTFAEYLTLMTELYTNLGRREEQYAYAKRCYNYSYTANWYKYIAANKIVDYWGRKGGNDAEEVEFTLIQLRLYIKDLIESERKGANDFKLGGPSIAETTLTKVLNRKSSFPNKGNLYGEAAQLLDGGQYIFDDALLSYYEAAVDEGVYLDEALEFCKIHMDEDEIVLDEYFDFDYSEFIEVNRLVGVKTLDKMAAKMSLTDCEKYASLASDYTFFSEDALAAEMTAKKDICLNDRKIAEEKRRVEAAIAEQKRLEQERIDAKRRKREEYRYNHPFNTYIGFYPLPMMTAVDKMDFGGHIDFRFKKVAYSFGFNFIQRKQDFTNYTFNTSVADDDKKQYWDGYKARFALKFFGDKYNRTQYAGLMLSYANKSYGTIQSDYTDNGVYVYNPDPRTIFKPTSRQGEAYLIFGMQALGKGIGTDYQMGIGVAVSQFDGGNERWHKDGVVINNTFIDKRQTLGIYPMFRLAWSIGVNLGPKIRG